ncbi:MAG: AAA family ATPase [Halanaerobiales bacterium]|nr:AAA family ATPase [Halanaerobiales bacterium]
MLIQEIIDSDAEVVLLPRPRRFGKSFNLSMLRYFFEKIDEDRSYLFEGLEIEKVEEKFQNHFGINPVIFLTFKDIKEQNWAGALAKIKKIISEEYKRHEYLLAGDFLDKYEKERFIKTLSMEVDVIFYEWRFKR